MSRVSPTLAKLRAKLDRVTLTKARVVRLDADAAMFRSMRPVMDAFAESIATGKPVAVTVSHAADGSGIALTIGEASPFRPRKARVIGHRKNAPATDTRSSEPEVTFSDTAAAQAEARALLARCIPALAYRPGFAG